MVLLAALVTFGTLRNLDRAVLDLLQVPHAPWLDLGASFITVLGQTEVLGSVALGVAIVRLRARRRDWWMPLLVIVVVAIEFVLKATVPQTPVPHELARNIPVLPFLEAPTPFSFPSGHVARTAFMAAALRWPASFSAAIVFVMALTRIYLGEHWPSDVIGGWLLGYGIGAIALSKS